MNNVYNIVCVANEGYAQHTAVMLCSLFETNKDKSFSVFLFTNGFGAESSKRLQTMCEKYHSKINILAMSDNEIKDLPVGQWNTMMYYKLFMPVMLPKECERCLFLDVDMIINDDIQTLYNWDLNGNIIAAADDIPDCDECHKPRLGLIQSDAYINSGVMVCDLNAWREKEAATPIFDYVKTISDIIMNEQDVIALYFKNEITILPIRWNMTTFYFMRVPKIFEKYLPQLQEAKRNPGVIHFAAPIKPWFKDCTHPYGKLYKKYLKQTDWDEWTFINWENLTPKQRISKKIKNFFNELGLLKDPLYTPNI